MYANSLVFFQNCELFPPKLFAPFFIFENVLISPKTSFISREVKEITGGHTNVPFLECPFVRVLCVVCVWVVFVVG